MTPKNPAAGFPRAGRVPPPAGGPSPAYPRSAGEGGNTRERAPAVRRSPAGTGLTPEPATTRPGAGSRKGGTAPGRERKTPAGGTLDADRVLSAGQMAIARAMKEDRGPDSLDAHVRRLLKDLGLRGYHTHDSRRSESGYPDWTITGQRTIFRELKTQRGKVSAAQQEWLAALTAAGDDAAVWRPADLLAGQVARELVAISMLAGAVA